MKLLLLPLTFAFSALLAVAPVYASTHPEGSISFLNASTSVISAKINGHSGFKLAANQTKQVKYSLVSRACSASPEACTAHFYADNKPIGSAVLNTKTGKLLQMRISISVKASSGANKVLRQVLIKG